MTEREAIVAWQTAPADGLEAVIAEFKFKLPGWWFSVCECQVSCDASCAPTKESPHVAFVEAGNEFDGGFHADLPQPSTLADALRDAMNQALAAVSAHLSKTRTGLGGYVMENKGLAMPSARATGLTASAPDGSSQSSVPIADILEQLKELQATLPPTPVLASCRIFPATSATTFIHKGRDYCIAHPDFWQQIPETMLGPISGDPGLFSFGALRIWDIDAPPNRDKRIEVFAALAQAIEARSGETGTGSTEGESAVTK